MSSNRKPALRFAVLAMFASLGAGCGVAVTKTSEPVQVTLKASSSGKPLNDVTLTLQPMSLGGQQADIKLTKGQGDGSVVPGSYTYYVEKGKNMSEVERLPEAFRRGAMDRKLEITQAGVVEVKLD